MTDAFFSEVFAQAKHRIMACHSCWLV